MKIKDTLSPVLSLKDKYILAYRIRKCSDMIKSDIKEWKETNEFPTRIVVLESPITATGNITISMEDLTGIYGLDIIDAFIFMDDLLKATTKDDKKELTELLGRLKSTGCIHDGNVTDALLEQIKAQQPGVWAAYQKLLAEEECKTKANGADDPLNDEI